MEFDFYPVIVSAGEYKYEEETGILAAKVCREVPMDQSRSAVEVVGEDGGIAIMELIEGEVSGIELVVWPEVGSDRHLKAPMVSRSGRLILKNNSGANYEAEDELEADFTCTVNPDASLLHVEFFDSEVDATVGITESLLFDVDSDNVVVGAWLLDLPVEVMNHLS